MILWLIPKIEGYFQNIKLFYKLVDGHVFYFLKSRLINLSNFCGNIGKLLRITATNQLNFMWVTLSSERANTIQDFKKTLFLYASEFLGLTFKSLF